jgi:hypothetical protein
MGSDAKTNRARHCEVRRGALDSELGLELRSRIRSCIGSSGLYVDICIRCLVMLCIVLLMYITLDLHIR